MLFVSWWVEIFQTNAWVPHYCTGCGSTALADKQVDIWYRYRRIDVSKYLYAYFHISSKYLKTTNKLTNFLSLWFSVFFKKCRQASNQLEIIVDRSDPGPETPS